jgi:hypothetical protein
MVMVLLLRGFVHLQGWGKNGFGQVEWGFWFEGCTLTCGAIDIYIMMLPSDGADGAAF